MISHIGDVYKWRHASRGEGVHIIVTTCDVGEWGEVTGSVTSHMSHLWKGTIQVTIDRQIHVANSPYVTG